MQIAQTNENEVVQYGQYTFTTPALNSIKLLMRGDFNDKKTMDTVLGMIERAAPLTHEKYNRRFYNYGFYIIDKDVLRIGRIL